MPSAPAAVPMAMQGLLTHLAMTLLSLQGCACAHPGHFDVEGITGSGIYACASYFMQGQREPCAWWWARAWREFFMLASQLPSSVWPSCFAQQAGCCGGGSPHASQKLASFLMCLSGTPIRSCCSSCPDTGVSVSGTCSPVPAGAGVVRLDHPVANGLPGWRSSTVLN